MMSSVIKPTLPLSLALFSLCLITLNGCAYGPGPYSGGYGANPYGTSPYGSSYPGSYPGGYQQAPIQTLQPGQQYVPNGTVVPGGVYPGGSGTSTPTYQNNGGGLQPIPNPSGASNDAPPYSSTEINKPVPNPSSPNGSPFYNNSASRTFQPPIQASEIQPASMDEPIRGIDNGLRESNINSPAQPNSVYSPPTASAPIAPISPISPNSSPMDEAIDINSPAAPPMQAIPPANFGNDPFGSPAPAPSQNDSAPKAMPLPMLKNSSNIKSYKPISEATGPFAHDENFKWLRGVVSKDEPTGTWSVVYSDNPQQSDKFAGHLSLAASPYLKGLSDGDVVELKGEVDPVMKDPLGKPVYLVSHLHTITKAPAQ
ncbi:hypothetical protein [Thalassoglobus polymorphus]|nr:hypothetical protein [Thalassoglobus polymorphus]